MWFDLGYVWGVWGVFVLCVCVYVCVRDCLGVCVSVCFGVCAGVYMSVCGNVVVWMCVFF